MKRKDLILTVLAVLIGAALLGREYPVAGKVVIVTAMIFYLLVDVTRFISTARRLGKTRGTARARVVMWTVLLAITLMAAFGGKVSYFLLLVLLAVDYILTERQLQNKV